LIARNGGMLLWGYFALFGPESSVLACPLRVFPPFSTWVPVPSPVYIVILCWCNGKPLSSAVNLWTYSPPELPNDDEYENSYIYTDLLFPGVGVSNISSILSSVWSKIEKSSFNAINLQL